MLVDPRSQLLREPRLLVPNVAPLGRVKVDASHWLAKSLRFAFVGINNPELVTGQPWAAISGVTNGPLGNVFTATSYVDLPATALANLTALSVGTVMACVVPTNVPTANGSVGILGAGSTSGTNYWVAAVQIRKNGALATTTIDQTVRTGQNTGDALDGYGASLGLTNNTAYVLGASFSGVANDYTFTINGAGSAVDMWIDTGDVPNWFAEAEGTGITASIGGIYYLGTRGTSMAGQIRGVIACNRVLTDGEQASLAADFFKFLIPA